jgi:peptidoglycan/xylan/chitin deacetylase (PgdA/CDA1 family)
VHWSANGDDWKGDPAPLLAERILTDLRPGGIILLHDGWEPPPHQTGWKPEYQLFQDRSPTIEALPMIIEPLQSQGYQFVTLPEMTRMKPLVKQNWFV